MQNEQKSAFESASKQLYSTSLVFEPEEGEKAKLRKKQVEQHKILKQLLTKQMTQKKESDD